jgi:hypothetical protein
LIADDPPDTPRIPILTSPIVPFHLPRTWKKDASDPFGSAALAIAGGSMMMKNA